MIGHSSTTTSVIRSWGRWIGVILVGCLLLSCSVLPLRRDGQRGIYHRVKKGETLVAIARAYHVNIRDLADVNRMDNPDLLKEDSVIFIPDVSYVIDDVLAASQTQPREDTAKTPEEPLAAGKEAAATASAFPPASPAAPAPKAPGVKDDKEPPPRAPASAPPPASPAAPAPKAPGVKDDKEIPPRAPASAPPPVAKAPPPVAPAERGHFIWPVKGKVISRFGDQPNQMRFNGIRIVAPDGTPVLAAAGGTVIYSAYLKGYGETLIIEHEGGYATVYTHLETRTVGKDYRVKQGDRIAFLGKTDNQDEPYLHFEIRHKHQARNPLGYLP
ncbi:MAG: peptidoglycan DD-metalloendopeptidase family protein [Syntrophaceae bacterium]|nr:peptidoglycan DD-metalloendopeptidase family protein [Syntrophaceae bacterium]